MNLMKPVLLFLSSSMLAIALPACGISTLGGGDGGGGGGGACEGPDPSSLQCATDADCDPGHVCSPDACAPSGCGCDEASGTWLCTADCTPGCVPAGNVCDDPDPSPEICDSSADCDAGWVCDLDACVPSHCQCDPVDGWQCTQDCRGACVPDSGACPEPDPSEGSCYSDSACGPGEVCVQAGCKPSHCVCGEEGWSCTEDCAGTCASAACDGPNPQGCMKDGCPEGEVCVQQGCEPSTCECNEEGWICTADCGGGVCVPAP